MQTFDRKQPRGDKLCNLQPGTLVSVIGSDGTTSQPMVIMADVGHSSLPDNATTPLPPPMPLPSQDRLDSTKVRLFDYSTGRIFMCHSSKRAVVHKGAAVVLNYIEGE